MMDEQTKQMQQQLDELRKQVLFLEFANEGNQQYSQQNPGNSRKVLEVDILKYQNGDIYEGEVLNDRFRHGDGVHTCSNGDIYDGQWEYDQRHGKGKFMQASGLVYEGDWKADKANGSGICKYADDSIYEGEWQNDHRNGWGKLSFKNGEEYEGEWENDKMHGFGRWVYADGAVFEGEYSDGSRKKGRLVSADQQVEYSGSFSNGVREGEGVLFCRGLWKYQGQFLGDKIHGYGRCEWIDSSVYEGHWKKNQRCGWGEYFSQSYKFQGTWKDDKRHGKGSCQYSNGDKFEGEWSLDQRNGCGNQTFSNGDYYEGNWKEDKRSGRGQCKYHNGDLFNGNWKDDKRHGFGKCIYSDGKIFQGQWEQDFWIQSPACARTSTIDLNSKLFQNGCRVGTEQSFQIFARDEDGSDRLSGGDIFKVQVTEKQSWREVLTKILDFGNGVYEVWFTPKSSGDYLVVVACVADDSDVVEHDEFSPLSCCPTTFTAHPSNISPKKCSIHIDTQEKSDELCLQQFKILLKDEFDNLVTENLQETEQKLEIEILCTHSKGQEISVGSRKEDEHTIFCSFMPAEFGFYRIQVEVNGVQITGSPFSIHVGEKNSQKNNEEQQVLDQSLSWLKIAHNAYAQDGNNVGWDSDDEKEESQEDRFTKQHPHIPVIDDLNDLWKLGKFQKFQQQKGNNGKNQGNFS